MKKKLATILTISVLALSLTACIKKTGDNTDGSDSNVFSNDPTGTTTEESHAVLDTRELPPVEASQSFGDYYVEDFDQAWAADKELRMATGTVKNYFRQYSFNSRNELVNDNLNTIATVSRPVITVFDSQDEGYAVYEVTYSQMFPIISREPTSVYRSFFSYHNVGYVDFYTGATFPSINLSTQIDSFCVYGNVIYNGKTYNVKYYEYRETEIMDSSYEQDTIDPDNYHIERCTVKVSTTAYFVVPKGYDGILMYVYVADDTDRPIDQVLAEDSPDYQAPGIFGDDENVNEHVFFGINQPK